MNNVLLFIIAAIIIYGVYQGIDVYGSFVEGAKEGVQTTVRIFPYMVALMVAITIFRTSGAIDLLSKIFAPVFSLLRLPVETLPLAILKPFSGGASIGILADIYAAYGTESYIGLVATVMMGSSETIFYTVALYFGYVGVKNTRHTVACAFIAMFAGMIGALVAVNLLF